MGGNKPLVWQNYIKILSFWHVTDDGGYAKKQKNKTKQKNKKTKTKKKQKKQKKKTTQCGNTGEQIVLNEPRKQWTAGSHIYKKLQNDIRLE